MTDTLYADVSEWQVPVDDSYSYPVLCIRSNDGTYRDLKWHNNYGWCRASADSGRLTFFMVYFVWRENWQETVATLKSQVGQPHSRMAVMLDVESWGGQITGNHSAGINAAFEDVAAWLGDRCRVIGYGNQGDLDTLWPQKPSGVRLVVAKYSTEQASYPGMIAQQYTDGQGYGSGPQGVSPFGNCDMNIAYNLGAGEFAALLGIGEQEMIPMETVLNYDHSLVGQETGYNCGPASAQVTLSCRGIYVPESQLAAECGTDEGGTDYVGLIENCLDPRLPEAHYTSVDAPNDPPLDWQRDKLWDGLRRSILSGYAVVMNWVVPANNRPVGIKGTASPNYGSYTTYHYVTAVGIDENPAQRAVAIADSGFQPPFYWISFDQCCTLIPPKALCYANLAIPAAEPPAPDYQVLSYEQLCGPIDPNTGYGTGWPQLGQNTSGQNLYVVDALSDILHALEHGEPTSNLAYSQQVSEDEIDYEKLAYEQLAGPVDKLDGYGHGWPQLGGRTITDAIAHIKSLVVEEDTMPPFLATDKALRESQR